MSRSVSVLEELQQQIPELRPQVYFKSALTALSHAMEDQVLAVSEPSLVIANFQWERYYRQEAQRYLRIAAHSDQVYVLAAPETGFSSTSEEYEKVAFDPADVLTNEWHLVVINPLYSTCLVCRERHLTDAGETDATLPLTMDQTRRFEGIWTFNSQVCWAAADIMLNRILSYRPELSDKIATARSLYLEGGVQLLQDGGTRDVGARDAGARDIDPDPFAQRLVTYLQAGQYKLIKAYRAIALKERRERLVNLMSSAIRRTLDTNQIFSVAVSELGQTLKADRCLIYSCRSQDEVTTVEHEFLSQPALPSLVGETWSLQKNPLIQQVMVHQETVALNDTAASSDSAQPFDLKPLSTAIERLQIRSWLLVPIVHQEKLMGMIELHSCLGQQAWTANEQEMVEAIAAQLGVALIQADAYANLENLNQQFEALERTRSNLIAITGHELRTPLSTIQVCLESLASEPDMPLEVRQVMLSTALEDAERMRKLVQDFLTLSQLESGRIQWHVEALSVEECVELALSSLKARQRSEELPAIKIQVPDGLPLVRADGEWLVEVLSKLLDNACKFTDSPGEVSIEAHRDGRGMLEVTVADTGRGIEPNRLEAVFDRFYQEEGALRRTAGGTGLGLAICRQVIRNLGGQIWAVSAGRGQGSQFHFTLPLFGIKGGKKQRASAKAAHNGAAGKTSAAGKTGAAKPDSVSPDPARTDTSV
ncbi:MAG: DICT sensory domain-containing protein [Elainellaceae cyanobacterium]